MERKHYFVPLSFWDKDGGESQIQCQLDIGAATCNVMSFNTLCEIKQSGSPAMQPTSTKLKLYNGSFVPALGECDPNCIYNRESCKLNFKIIKGDEKPLLSGETCTSMGPTTVHIANSLNTSPITASSDIFMEYKDVFEGLGRLPGEYHLDIDPDAQPVKHTPRRSAIPLKAELKGRIETLEKIGMQCVHVSTGCLYESIDRERFHCYFRTIVTTCDFSGCLSVKRKQVDISRVRYIDGDESCQLEKTRLWTMMNTVRFGILIKWSFN